jgi:hypothetical protein
MRLIKGLLEMIAHLFGITKRGTRRVLDVNGDGSIDFQDVKVAGRVAAGSVAAAVTVTAGSAAAGAAIGTAMVGAKAASLGATVATASGSAVGLLGGIWAGTTAIPGLLITQIGSLVIIESATLVTVSAPVVAAWTATATAASAAAEAASGFVAGMPLIKSAAASSLEASGQILLVAGVPISIQALIVAGLVLSIVLGAVAYYVITKEGQEKGLSLNVTS